MSVLQLFSSGDAAKRLGICRETLISYVKKKMITPHAIVKGHHLFHETELTKFEIERQKLKKIAPNAKAA